MKIISWNCNSATIRYEQIKNLLEKYKPDILMLQETRTELIPNISNYYIYHNPAIKGRNGVAIISPHSLTVINQDDQGRLIHCILNDMHFVCVYVPNGGSISSSVDHKLQFFENLSNLYLMNNLIIGGDFNVLYREGEYTIPHPYSAIETDALMFLEKHLNYYTAHHPYITWWDYRENAFKRNLGYGIDKIYNSRNLHLKPIQILYDFRKKIKPSDHAPIYTELISKI
jgi:exodeoxyribonuclease-3